MTRLIAQISDLHFGRHDPRVAEALLASLAERRPDLMAASGDFTQRARREEFVAARQFMDRIAAPKVIVPGNHDMPLFGLHRRLFAPFAHYERYLAPAGAPAYRDDAIAMLGLNTARRFTGKNGRVSHEQIAAIRCALCAVPADVVKVLVTHHPVGLPDGAAPTDLAWRSRAALQMIGACGVDLLLSGHHHRASSGEIVAHPSSGAAPLLIVYAGTAISTRLRGGEDNSYNLIRVEPAALTVTVMRHEPAAGFLESRSATYRRDDGRWRAEAA